MLINYLRVCTQFKYSLNIWRQYSSLCQHIVKDTHLKYGVAFLTKKPTGRPVLGFFRRRVRNFYKEDNVSPYNYELIYTSANDRLCLFIQLLSCAFMPVVVGGFFYKVYYNISFEPTSSWTKFKAAPKHEIEYFFVCGAVIFTFANVCTLRLVLRIYKQPQSVQYLMVLNRFPIFKQKIHFNLGEVKLLKNRSPFSSHYMKTKTMRRKLIITETFKEPDYYFMLFGAHPKEPEAKF